MNRKSKKSKILKGGENNNGNEGGNGEGSGNGNGIFWL